MGYDANALYLWALMQDMPTGWYVRRREENQFRPQKAQPFGQMAVQWLTWESAKSGCAISAIRLMVARSELASVGWMDGVLRRVLPISSTGVFGTVARNATTKMKQTR